MKVLPEMLMLEMLLVAAVVPCCRCDVVLRVGQCKLASLGGWQKFCNAAWKTMQILCCGVFYRLHLWRFLFGSARPVLGNQSLSLKSFVSAVRDDEFMANQSRRRFRMATPSNLVSIPRYLIPIPIPVRI